ncbi:MAG: DUF6049 family protein [Propionicimonas sp.]
MNRRPGLLRRAVAVAAAAFVAMASLTWTAPAATAAEPRLAVEITGVTVSGNEPSDHVTVTGRVSNPSGAQVRGLWMAIWRSRDPIGDLVSLHQVTGTSVPPGVILPENKNGSYHQITDRNTLFPAGATTEFTVQASLADLGFDTLGKAYLVGARAVGTEAGNTSPSKVGQGQTVITLADTTVPVTRLVVLSATPTKLASGVFRNEDLVGELSGRLDQLLTAAGQPGNSWLIDPALYDEVTDLANGYQVRQGTTLKPGTGQQTASAWLRRFRQLDRAAGARTLFALPDLAGAAAADDPAVLARARTATAQVTDLDDLPLLVWPTAGDYSEAVDAYLGGETPLLAINPLGAGARQTAGTGRPVLAAAITLPANPGDFPERQLALAETLLAGEVGQLRVLREPIDLDADAATTADWQQPRRLDELLAAAGQPGGFAAAEPATLDRQHFKAVSALEQAVASYRQLAPDSVIPDEAAALLTRAVSQAWIGQDAARAGLLKDIDQLIGPTALKNAVELDASPRFVMSARTSQFPLTVSNHLAEAIQVKVQVTTDNPQRLRIPDSDVVTVPPGQSVSITIRPEATANGVAIAEARVATVEGTPLAGVRPAEITIEMTELGFVGWVIVIASGAVVLGATALRIWQVRRRSRPAADSPLPPPPAPSSIEGSPNHRGLAPGEKPSAIREALNDSETGADGITPDGITPDGTGPGGSEAAGVRTDGGQHG